MAPAFTENGWPSCNANQLDRRPIPGTNIVIPLQQGLPRTVIAAFVADFHMKVESLMNARGGTDEGGWTPTNSVWNSNHLGGTAVDLNWSEHHFKISLSGFSPAEVAELPKLLEFYTYKGLKLIFWGEDWQSPKDPMHFQMGYNTYENRHLVQEFVDKFIRPDGFSTYVKCGSSVPSTPRKLVIPDAGGTFWVDASQYQTVVVQDSYKHKVFSFRTNSGDKEDILANGNALQAKRMLDEGQLEIVIPYYFFRPGQANCDLHKAILERAGLWNHPRTVTMVDVEGDNGSVTGDNSWEINDEIDRIRKWYGNYHRVIGYLNSNADPSLWKARGGINLVVPQYYRTPGDISSIRDEQVRRDAIAHQFTDKAMDQPPWEGRGVDVNWSPYSVDELLLLFGMVESEEDWMSDPTIVKMIREIHGALFNSIGSQSRYRADGEGNIWQLHELIKNMDASRHEEDVETRAIRGSLKDAKLVVRNAVRGDPLAMVVVSRIPKETLEAAGANADDVYNQYTTARAANPHRTVFFE